MRCWGLGWRKLKRWKARSITSGIKWQRPESRSKSSPKQRGISDRCTGAKQFGRRGPNFDTIGPPKERAWMACVRGWVLRGSALARRLDSSAQHRRGLCKTERSRRGKERAYHRRASRRLSSAASGEEPAPPLCSLVPLFFICFSRRSMGPGVNPSSTRPGVWLPGQITAHSLRRPPNTQTVLQRPSAGGLLPHRPRCLLPLRPLRPPLLPSSALIMRVGEVRVLMIRLQVDTAGCCEHPHAASG